MHFYRKLFIYIYVWTDMKLKLNVRNGLLRLFHNMLDMTFVNAWFPYKRMNQQRSEEIFFLKLIANSKWLNSDRDLIKIRLNKKK